MSTIAIQPDTPTKDEDVSSTISSTGATNTAEHLSQQALPASVLKRLFERLHVPVSAGALQNACQQSSTSLKNASPVQRCLYILKTLHLKGIRPAQLRWQRLDQRRLPAMVFYQQQWQLVEHSEDGLLHLTNEEGESQKCNKNELDECVVLWLGVRKSAPAKSVFSMKDNIAARLVLREMFKSRAWLSDVLIATLVINVLAIGTSIFAMQVYDRVVPTLAYATLTTLVFGMAIIICLTWILKTLRARILDSVSCSVDKAVSQQVFDHIMALQLDTRPRSLGTLAAQVSGLDSVRQFFTSSVIFTLIDMPFALIFIVFIAIIGGPVAWVYVLLLPAALILGWVTQKRQRSLMHEQMIRSNERQGLLVDTIRGAESIRSNNANWRFSEQWQAITSSIASFNIQQKAINTLATSSTAGLSNGAYVCAIVVGVLQIEAGNITMGALIACSILGGKVIGPVSQAINFLGLWENVRQSLQMVNQVLEQNTERHPEQTLLMPDEAPDKIELEGLSFSYPQSPVQQLNIAHLCFKAGDRVALLGPVGSGKSTLLKVLAGLYRPSTGRIRLGNADLWEIDPNIIADHINYLPQSVHMFKGTLRSNLDLSGVVSDSHLLDIINLLNINSIADGSPQGIDLEISEGGEGLSVGQRQLVGLARVFLAQPRIWLLDEPTASLDPESEKQVLAAIKSRIKPDDILLISTHRLSLVTQLATRVITMRQGEIIEDGKPDVVLPKLMSNSAVNNNSGSHNKKGKIKETKFIDKNKGVPNVI